MSAKTERGGDVSGPVGNAASVAYATQYTLEQLRHTTLFYVLYSQTRCTLEAYVRTLLLTHSIRYEEEVA